MLDKRWMERCQAQRVPYLDGEAPDRAVFTGIVLARDGRGVYPVGLFEVCGEVVIYPPQTLNPAEESAMLAAAMGLARAWDGSGVLTMRFAKQRDGSDFALLDVDEEISAEAKHLLTLRGLWDGAGASFLQPGGKAPELPELSMIGISMGEKLHTADNLRGALLQLPEPVRAAFVGWYDKVLRHEG
ncbi:MAG: hypothetical protein LBI19_04505 [Oscillospiraceae bacterium]|jgi:hypothetical protein|nr:hypothetical protein [Oscillospiraceae bacterium]